MVFRSEVKGQAFAGWLIMWLNPCSMPVEHGRDVARVVEGGNIK